MSYGRMMDREFVKRMSPRQFNKYQAHRMSVRDSAMGWFFVTAIHNAEQTEAIKNIMRSVPGYFQTEGQFLSTSQQEVVYRFPTLPAPVIEQLRTMGVRVEVYRDEYDTWMPELERRRKNLACLVRVA